MFKNPLFWILFLLAIFMAAHAYYISRNWDKLPWPKETYSAPGIIERTTP